MVKSNRRPSEPVYEIRDDPSVKIFDNLPSRAVRNDFLDHLKKTGRPQDWRWHLSTTPPKQSRARIIEEFVIPVRLRSSVLMAPCPICSPRHPKYWEGMLAWFEAEMAIRAIGRECGHQFLEDFAIEIARYHRSRAIDQDYDFLERNWSKIFFAKRMCEALFPRARHLDKTRDTIRTVISNKAIQDIARLMAGSGQLILYDTIRSPVLDAIGGLRFDKGGAVIKRDEIVVARRFEFRGIDALRELKSRSEANLVTALKLLDGLVVQNEDEFISLAVEYQTRLEELVFRLNRAWIMIQSALSQLENFRLLAHPSTIKSLGEWGRDKRAIRRIKANYVRDGLLDFGEIDKKSRLIPIHGSLMQDVPVLAPLR